MQPLQTDRLDEWVRAHVAIRGAVECRYVSADPSAVSSRIVRYDFSTGAWASMNGFSLAVRHADGSWYMRASPEALPAESAVMPIGADCQVSAAIPAVGLLDILRRQEVIKSIRALPGDGLELTCVFDSGSRCADPSHGAIGPAAEWVFELSAEGHVRSIQVTGGPIGQERWEFQYAPGSRPGVAVSETLGPARLESMQWYDSAPAEFFKTTAVEKAFQQQQVDVRRELQAIGTAASSAGATPVPKQVTLERSGAPLLITGAVVLGIALFAWYRRK